VARASRSQRRRAFSTQELIEREKAKRLAEQPKEEETAAETVTAPEEEYVSELPLPTFGEEVPLTRSKAQRKANPEVRGKAF